MQTIYRQLAFHRLTEAQQQKKLKKDSEYEIAVQNLSAEFYRKKRSTGVSPKEEHDYQTQKAKLWKDYEDWAIANGLYEEVTPEQQLAEAEAGLAMQVEQVNQIRAELKKPLVEITEKIAKEA